MAALVGTLDGGWPELLDVLNTERIVTTAGLVGAAELAIRLGVDYAKERKVFAGKPIAAYQGIQFPLAQHWAEVECARLMNYKAATLFDTGKPYGTEANVAKLLASQAASAGIEQAMQTMGGMGFAGSTSSAFGAMRGCSAFADLGGDDIEFHRRPEPRPAKVLLNGPQGRRAMLTCPPSCSISAARATTAGNLYGAERIT
jgi:hypothetical protein